MPKESLTCSPNWQIQKASLAMNTFTVLKEERTGFLAWRLKFVQKEASDGKKRKSQTPSPKGWDGDISSILVLLHLLPPPPHGCKRPGKLSARQAYDQLVKFLKTGTSIQDHLDSVRESRQPYLLACGNTKHMIHKYYIVTDKHVIPCKSSDSLAAFDELFKAHFGFGTSYNQDLINVYNFLQTTIYDIDVGSSKVSPRVAELRARFL
ncbi:uncharacterized protein LOC110158784 [Boleophthalmus pectinirostris]|uniref:uncharacterized protein LOC110158784 n=1 Tax=Boleophthalmus pectinirostris TaxID=150288 RepID=UPI0024331677|nr:uncharacterized protein LOC110158784 [Boleophthalmus pectinirostris]